MNSPQPLVSVLTPVYNGEKYLSQCIESVLHQTYGNWEYIIVNNCSTDRTVEIAQSYAIKDSRIRIRNNRDFVGVMQNHNIAFREMSPASRYCKVVQADDWLFPNCLSEMVQVAEANTSVGIVGSYCLSNDRVKCDGLTYPSTVVRGRELCRLTLLGKLYLFWRPTSLLIRSDLIRHATPFYNESHLHGDDEAAYEILGTSDFGFVHQVLTYVRRHEESVTSSFVYRFNAIILSKLDLLIKFGPVYLSADEHRKLLAQQKKEYYRFLAKNIFRWNERKEFWSYHRNGLKNIGYPLNKFELMKELFLEAIDLALNPKRVIRDITSKMPRFSKSATAGA